MPFENRRLSVKVVGSGFERDSTVVDAKILEKKVELPPKDVGGVCQLEATRLEEAT